MVSLAARAMPAIMRLRGSKRIYATAERTLADVARLQADPRPFAPPFGYDEQLAITLERHGEWPVYTVAAHGATSGRRVLYTHGGTWIHEISPRHWMLIRALAIETGATFIVPIFPGAPNGTAATVVPWVAELLEELVTDAGGSEVTAMGDSAGGAITLSALQLLRDRGAVLPGRAVLISPAIDLRFTDPRIAQIEPRDPALSVPGPRAAAELWRGELAIEDPLVSPLLGDASGLPPLTVFCGSRDICYPDSLNLVAKARAAGVEVEFHNERGLLHVYPLMPIPEARAAQAVMAQRITGR
ncbi:alpha/beta hydrolase fold domain-containing protein [Naasia lichenicola]|uniref:Alpha/beta hydrolase n=1 Tax=Naasia lichenicola TaxID=2565933 RepID=A0A4V3WSK3_9MICO|nr:alpha/beta hydrolase [Naasia lichenicola]THG28457.1 alpha/beta hydrolase [Naasia lichenicola]